MKPRIFVIVVTYKGKQWYDRCFGSLRISSCPVTTVVIDNNSADGTVEYIKKVYPEIILFESDRNMGFGQANNKGLRYALDNGCDYVFLLNQDAWVETDTLGDLVSVAQNNPQYAIVSPLHLTAGKDSFEAGFMKYLDDFRNTDEQIVNDLFFGELKHIYETKYVNAAAWLLPRKTLEEIGGFDPLFFHYGEDDNYMSRVLYHGYKIGICPQSKIVHDAAGQGIRITGKQEQLRRQKVCLLIEFSDLRQQATIFRRVFYFVRKMFVSIMSLNVKSCSRFYRDAVFLLKSRRRILTSRKKNVVKGRNWL